MRRTAILCFLALLAACGGSGDGSKPAPGPGASAAVGPVLNFANFADEIAPTTLPAFERETGVKVNYDLYESNLMLESRLVVGSTGLDVVVPGSQFLARQIQSGIYRKLDKSQLPNLRHIDPALLAKLERYDPGNQYGIPYLWGTFGLVYNVDLVEKILGGPAPDSYALLFDPAYASRLQKCGIAVSDTPWTMIGMALLYLGKDPTSQSEADLDAAIDVLVRIRPYLIDMTNAPIPSQLAEGQYCLAAASASDARAGQDRAREAGLDTRLRYVIPKEGALVWIDMLAVPVDAPNPADAHRLIDFLMRPQVIADVTNHVYFANANLAATALLRPDVRDDPAIYPTEEQMRRLHLPGMQTAEYTRLQNRAFARFRTGN
jgi:putrescine transport system substrate-binding protein